MVESNEDPELVTMTIRRETAKANREREEAKLVSPRETQSGVSTGSLMVETHAAVPPRPVDPEASYRHMRLGICAALVVLLTVVWIWQRKS